MDTGLLTRILQSVGMSVFVKYYRVFQQGDRARAIASITESYTEKSKASRTSHALRIFAEKQELLALRMILESSRTTEQTRNMAQQLYQMESGVKK